MDVKEEQEKLTQELLDAIKDMGAGELQELLRHIAEIKVNGEILLTAHSEAQLSTPRQKG